MQFSLCQNTLDRGVLMGNGTIAHAQNLRHLRFTVRDAELLYSVSFSVVYIFLMASTFPINLQCCVALNFFYWQQSKWMTDAFHFYNCLGSSSIRYGLQINICVRLRSRVRLYPDRQQLNSIPTFILPSWFPIKWQYTPRAIHSTDLPKCLHTRPSGED